MIHTKNDDTLIAKAMLNHLNQWPDRPCDIRLENMEKEPIAFSIAMQQLAGTRVLKSYINGSFIGQWPFAVYVRFGSVDTAKRFQAVSYLEMLGDWLCNSELPDIGTTRTANEIEMTSLPSIAGTYESGAVDYQTVFLLTYKQRSE